MSTVGTPGAAYAVVGPEGIEHAATFGVDGDGAPVTSRTPFLWGSVAKPVAATAVLTLVEDGLIDLDAPVTRYLPAFEDFEGDPSVRDLLTQTSGLTAATALAVSDEYGPEATDTERRVARVLESDPGNPGEFEYSSANYLLIGAIVEAVSGTDYGSYLRASVLDPAGMTDTFTDTEEARALGLAAGQRTLWGFPSPVPARVDDGGAAYGYLGGDLDSLAAFARMQLVEDPPVLDATTLGEARTGAVERSPGREYGLGWWDAPVPGVDEHVVWHAGATPGFATMMIVLPERERAVVVLQNGYDNLRDGEVQAVGFGLAHLLTGGDAPVEPEKDPLGPALVWGATTAIPLSVTGAVTAVIHLRRGRVRRRWTAWFRVVFAALSVTAVVALSATIGVRAGLLWFPEAAVAILVSGVLGGFVLVTRGVALVRRGRGNRRPRPGSDR